MRTGYDLVWLAAERTPDRLAIVDDQSPRALTYRQLIQEVDVIAAGLQRQGIRAGDRIAVAAPNSLQHCLALLALQRLGAVLALINFRLPAQQIAELIADGRMRGALIADDPSIARAIVERTPALPLLITLGGFKFAGGDLGSCRGDPQSLPPPPTPHPDDIGFILYTSGTTGKPKGVAIAHRTTEYRITSLSPMAGLHAGRELRVLGVLPLFHGMGFFVGLMNTLAYSGTFYLMSAFSPQAALDMIERRQINFIFVVPTILQAIVALPTYRPERVASLEYVLHGGAAIAPALLDRLCTEWSARIQHLYGSTEAYIPLCNPDPKGAPNTFSSVFPQRSRVVRIGGGPNDIARPDEPGELIVADSDCMFSGYLDNPQATASKLRDGWFFTGDVFTHRHDGAFDFVGRVDDAIRSGGESIYPAEIEQIILTHPGVDEVCVVGIPDNYWGEQVVACIVARRKRVSAGEIDRHCRAAVLAGFKRPRQYVFVDDLPRNASNKILRRELREMVIASEDRPLCA
jgi:2-furoate---CoA ligase